MRLLVCIRLAVGKQKEGGLRLLGCLISAKPVRSRWPHSRLRWCEMGMGGLPVYFSAPIHLIPLRWFEGIAFVTLSTIQPHN